MKPRVVLKSRKKTSIHVLVGTVSMTAVGCPRKLSIPSETRLTHMQFTRKLHEGIIRGDITCTVRIWLRPRVKVCGAYSLPPGKVVVESITQIGFEDISPALARQSGFDGVIDLLKTAKHGRGEIVYLITFHYRPPSA